MSTRAITIKEASEMMHQSEQFVRRAVIANKIPGAFYLEGRNGERGQYFITNTQVENMMKGAWDVL